MKELGELKHFLGLEVEKRQDGLFLSQWRYAIVLLEKFGLQECKPMTTPMEANVQLNSQEGKDLEDVAMYRRLVGSLIYLTSTCPDISYVVGVVSRFMQNPKKVHLEIIKRVLRYVKGTIEHGIFYKKGADCKLEGYCNADYAGDLDIFRSTTGLCSHSVQEQCHGAIKRQSTVSLSSTEAEYRAAAMASQECTWLVQLLKDLHQEVDYPVPLYCNNLSAIKLAENPVFHARTNHVEVHYHFLREKVLKEEIEMKAVKTGDQVAYIFTKAFSRVKFEEFRSKLGMIKKK
ncbi:unnamed protein product [Linum trigynum]|uniref:Retrovirus-related Pol polyprotein from transposon RE1 n=1 Tax=Linum trigynum TaxID=586398 RepID=A0AAV2CFU3_9ROSI